MSGSVFSLESFGAPCKFPMLRFSRVYCPASFPPNSTNLYEKYGNQEGMQVVTFAIYQMLKVYGTLRRSYLSYVVIIHKARLFSSD